MDTTSLKEKSIKTLTRAIHAITFFLKNTVYLFSKRDFAIIAFFTILGIGGVFAAGRVVLTPTESQGAGYSAVTACDPNVTINKDITFDLTLSRYVISTISITDVNQSYISGCGNQIMELALPLNGGVTYASWTIPSSTFTNGVFTFGASDSSTGITYRAYTTLNPIDVEYSFASAAINTRASTRAVTNGPVFDLLKDNGFTTAGQSNSSNTLTFALSLTCGTLTVDTTKPGVSAALANLSAPTGYVTNNATSTGANGATNDTNEILAAYLGFRGSLADINTVLPWISYSWKSGCINTPKFQAAIWDALDASNPVAWNFPGNGNYYQLIKTQTATPFSWDQAFLDITGFSANYNTAGPSTTTRSFANCKYQVFGMCGYFATVSSKAENDFIYSKSAQKGVWLGGLGRCGRTSCVNRGFYWVDPVAPGYGTVFSTGRTGVATAGNFANWYNNEPNGSIATPPGESALQIMGGDGRWNDLVEHLSKPASLGDRTPGNLANWNTYDVLGYVVEYGGSTAVGESPTGGGSSTPVIEWHY
jgi:hypothetical protein